MKLTMHAGLVRHNARRDAEMDARTFFGLGGSRPSARWRMEVVRGLTSGTGALFGGCGLGACIEVMEQVTGRPCIWATAQYLSFARPPSVVELDAVEVVRGHQISQARVIARVGDTEILTVLGALGRRPLPLEGQWAVRPDVPGPADCPPRPLMNRHEGTISSRLDARIASGRAPWELSGPQGSGHAALWIRMPELLDMSAAALAIIGDFVPFGIGQRSGSSGGSKTTPARTGRPRGARRCRVRRRRRIRHGLVHLWAGRHAIGCRSSIARAWRRPGR